MSTGNQRTSGNQGTNSTWQQALINLLGNSANKSITTSITRPSNSTTYAVGDVINDNGSVKMTEINLRGNSLWLLGGQSISSVSQSSLQYDCLFFKNPFDIATDNSPFAPTDQQLKDNYLGRISFASFFALANNAICDGAPASIKPIVIPVKTVYMVRVATTAYGPVSGEVITERFDYQKA